MEVIPGLDAQVHQGPRHHPQQHHDPGPIDQATGAGHRRRTEPPMRPADASRAAPPGWRAALRVAASREGQVQEHVIGFLSHRGNRVAYAVTGNGPPLLMDVGRAHHLEVFWQHAPYRRLVQGLARQFTVIRWDRPGFGLSDRSGMDLSPAGELALVERLAALLGPEPVAILAAGDG